MEGWIRTSLGEIAKVQSGAGFPKKYQGVTDGDFPFAKVSDMNLPGNEITIHSANNWVTEDVREILKAKVFPKNSIIFPKIGAAIATNKKRFVSIPCCVDNNVMGLIPNTARVKPEFLYYWLLNHDLSDFANDSELPSIKKTTVEKFPLSIPESLPEQERIVAMLDEAFAAIDIATANTEKNLANAKELFESYSDRMFKNLCDTLQEKTLDDVCENLDRQRVPITKSKRVSGLVPYYGASGVVDHVDKSLFDEDLLLVSEDGANLLARTYPIAFSISGPSWVNNHAHVLRFQSMAYQKFAEFYLNSISLEPFVSGMAQPKLNQTKLNTIPIPWPENDQQASEVVKSLVAIESESNSVSGLAEQKLSHYANLKQSLLQKAFTGELTADPKVVNRALSEASV